MARTYYVYMLTNFTQTVLYTGFTSNLKQRIHQHSLGLFEGFTKKYNVKYLVYFETFNCVHEAIAREKNIKCKTRKKKNSLVESANPTWRDLSNDIF